MLEYLNANQATFWFALGATALIIDGMAVCKLDNGEDLFLERLVAPIFIQSQQYGTRASSAVLLPREGAPMMREQCWRADGEADGAPTDS